ncbi:diguanylate cyclase [Cryptosporangium japonicum]|uniref:AAA family ATPase n=1 Tax=Cryptosporangium japonicum TaxID=80872 RepID=A0ABN0U2Q2_9ACTN
MTDARTRTISGSARTRVSRVAGPDGRGTAVCKEMLGPGAAARAHHERTILERLAGVAGVVPLISGSGHALLLADLGDVTLATGRVPLPDLPALARQLAHTLSEVHARGVTHRDLAPSNVLLTPAGPVLVDFDLATTAAEERPGFLHARQIVGDPAYLAPELTGRTARSVDQRADLYSLGATLYRAATGAAPFGDGDPLRLVQDHLTRIPRPPIELVSAVPPSLSAIIVRLLEKDPERRYQSALGVALDLERVAEHPGAVFPLGTADFPRRLTPSARLVGRDREVGVLTDAFTTVCGAPDGGAVLVSGAPGVGKSRLIAELRPVVSRAGGWLVGGKFDKHRRDEDGDAVRQALRSLGRLLLAEQDVELEPVRDRLRAVLGGRAGLLAAFNPELGAVLRTPPVDLSDADVRTGQTQLIQLALDVLRTLATPQRPIVLVLDDVQWAGPSPLAFVDTMISGGGPPCVLLVAAYRHQEVGPDHPLAPMLDRWRRLNTDVEYLRLESLSTPACTELVAEILRAPIADVADLADAVRAHTGGNPFDTIQVLNELRREERLSLDRHGWRWDGNAVGAGNVVELLTARMAEFSASTRNVLAALALLGGELDPETIGRAAGLAGTALDEALAPALETGLLVVDHALDELAVKFVHDRAQQAAAALLPGDDAGPLRLAIARRLATVPGREVVAATQYLPVLSSVTDPDERRRAADLCRRAAATTRLLSDWESVDRLMTAAEHLVGRDVASATARHAALVGLGRTAEADALHAWIAAQPGDPADRATADALQISSLIRREEPGAGLALGLELLSELGLARPDGAELSRVIDEGLDRVRQWTAAPADAAPPRLRAIAAIANATIPAAFFCDQPTMHWLAVECARLWAEHGPVAELVGPVSHLGFVAVARRQDYRLGHDVLPRVLAVSEEHGWEPHTSQARFLYALGTACWFAPPDEVLAQVRRAHEGLVRGGDLHNACYTAFPQLGALLESAQRVEDLAAEADSAVAFCLRTSNEQPARALAVYGDLARVLVGELASMPAPDVELHGNVTAIGNVHTMGALAAALFDDVPALVAHTDVYQAALPFLSGTAVAFTGYLLRALALIRGGGDEAQLRAATDWITARAADCPANFAAAVDLLAAEQHRARDDFAEALRAYDRALSALDGPRPWLRAHLTERVARLHLERGFRYTGRIHLDQARELYAAWGATTKVAALDAEFPPRRVGPSTGRPDRWSGGGLTADTIDLRGVLAASQALSAELTLDQLSARVTEVLGAMTGATRVHVLVRDDDGRWASEDGVPLSAVRYAERSGETLLVEDACADDWFARDPYFADLDHCSLLVVPVLHLGAEQALLVLVNTLASGAFTTDRLDLVQLVAGQLAVSFANARLYTTLERRIAERTAELAEANHRLEQLSVTDPLTGLANRRRFVHALDTEWDRGLRSKTSFALAILDVDHFKQYNDRYGHPAGDDCLRAIAAALDEGVRATDLVARYGGEEFAVVMPDSDLAGALVVAERVRAAVEKLAMTHAGSPLGVVTVSVGVAAVVPHADAEVGQLLADADAQLYRAKQNGRNQVAG